MQEEALNESKLPVGDDWGLEPESEKGFLHAEKNGQIIKEYITSPKGAYNDYFTELYKAIREGAPSPVSAEDGLNVIRIIEAAFESSRQKRVIEWPITGSSW